MSESIAPQTVARIMPRLDKLEKETCFLLNQVGLMSNQIAYQQAQLCSQSETIGNLQWQNAVLNGRVTSLEKKNLTLESGMQKLQDDLDEHYLTQEVSALYTYDENKNLLSPASDRVCKRSLEAVRTQKNKFVHGDRPKNLGKARAALKRKVLEQVENRNVSQETKD